jgi:hypothetical protein
LSLNAVSRTQSNRAIHLTALIGKKVFSILVDSRSSHTFLNANMLQRVQLQTVPTNPMKVKVVNGHTIQTGTMVNNLQWWIQDSTFSISARILELAAYDLILGMDWLEEHSPMQCD